MACILLDSVYCHSPCPCILLLAVLLMSVPDWLHLSFFFVWSMSSLLSVCLFTYSVRGSVCFVILVICPAFLCFSLMSAPSSVTCCLSPVVSVYPFISASIYSAFPYCSRRWIVLFGIVFRFPACLLCSVGVFLLCQPFLFILINNIYFIPESSESYLCLGSNKRRSLYSGSPVLAILFWPAVPGNTSW